MQSGTDYHDASAGREAEPAAPPVAGKPLRRARIGLLLLVAFLTEVVVIAAVGNQAVINKVQASSADARSMRGGLQRALETFGWRFAPRTHDIFHVWSGGLALIGTTVVLSLLLIFAVVRGPFAFGRAFFGTWLAVVVATMAGGYVRALVVDNPADSRRGIPARALFSPLAPGSTTFLAGLALGLIVAVIVALLGLATRRPAVVAVPAGDAAADPEDRYNDDRYADDSRFADDRYADDRERYEQPGPASGFGYGTQENPTRGVPWRDDRNAPATGATAADLRREDGPHDSTDTTALPAMRPSEHAQPEDSTAALQREDDTTQAHAVGEDDAHTAALPREDDTTQAHAVQPDRTPEPAHAGRGQHEHDEQTTQFPRPPDDEDLHPERP